MTEQERAAAEAIRAKLQQELDNYLEQYRKLPGPTTEGQRKINDLITKIIYWEQAADNTTTW